MTYMLTISDVQQTAFHTAIHKLGDRMNGCNISLHLSHYNTPTEHVFKIKHGKNICKQNIHRQLPVLDNGLRILGEEPLDECSPSYCECIFPMISLCQLKEVLGSCNITEG